MIDRNKREYFDKRFAAMKTERQSFISHYQELSKFIRPRKGRFTLQDRNKGDKRYNNIVNSWATEAEKVARAGLMAGMMSPVRPWFSLETPDPDMMEYGPVKEWLYKVEMKMRAIFNESNFYNMAPTLLSELLIFGTGFMTQVDDFENVARFYTHTAGSYMIAQDEAYRVNTAVREFEWSVEQIIGSFGIENVSSPVRTAYDRGDYDAWFPCVHFIEPNKDSDTRNKGAGFKPFRSVYYEPGQNEKEKFLRKSGFDQFPGYAPRWDVTGEDIYGTDCPAMTALGDIKGLQIGERRKAQAVDKMVAPPLKGPPSLRSVPVSGLPGNVTVYEPHPNDARGLSPIYEVRPQLQDMRIDLDAIQHRIDRAFYVDMFLAISQAEGIQPRNELDLIQRNEERLLQLGPVLERLQSELLNPIIDRTFNQALAAGILPPPPPELAGAALRVKYISSLAMAQRAVSTSSIERVAGFAGGLVGSGFVEAADKFDADQAIDEFAQALGAPPRIVVPDEIVAQKREARAQQQQMAQAAEMAQMGANATKMLGDAKMDGNSVLGQMAEAK